MEKIDMIKAFADLGGVGVHLAMEDKPGAYWYSEELSKEYDPIEDHALTYKALIHYKVQKIHSMVNSKKIMLSIRGAADVISVFDESEVPSAIIECILKSKGLWK